MEGQEAFLPTVCSDLIHDTDKAQRNVNNLLAALKMSSSIVTEWCRSCNRLHIPTAMCHELYL